MDAGAPQRLEQSDQSEDHDDPERTSREFKTLDRAGGTTARGRIIFPGVAFGHAFLETPLHIPIEQVPLDEKTIADEINKLKNAVELAHSHLELQSDLKCGEDYLRASAQNFFYGLYCSIHL